MFLENVITVPIDDGSRRSRIILNYLDRDYLRLGVQVSKRTAGGRCTNKAAFKLGDRHGEASVLLLNVIELLSNLVHLQGLS